MSMLPMRSHITPAFESQAGAEIAGDWISMKNYNKCMILMHEMRGADATATVVRVDKARSVTGTNESTGMTMKHFWHIQDVVSVTGDVGASVAALSDTWTKGTAAASYTGSVTQSVACYFMCDIQADELPDATYQDYDCIQLQVVSSNAAHTLSAQYILYEPRYSQLATPTAIIN